MKVLPYDSSMLPEVTLAYNTAVAGVPHCYPVDQQELASALCPGAHEGRYCDQVLVAADDETTVGFVHVAIVRAELRDWADYGMIRFLYYTPGRRSAGDALLTAAEDHVRGRGVTRILAFHQDHKYAFYHLPQAYLSDRLGHVHGLLGLRGYVRANAEVFMDWPDYTPVESAIPDVGVDVSVVLRWENGQGKRPDLTVVANCDQEEEIGVCANCSSGRPWWPPEAEDWLHTHWISVGEPYRRKGLGRYMLQRALKEMHDVGYRHAAISTDWRNFPAMLFYTNCGYHVVDWTYGLARDLE